LIAPPAIYLIGIADLIWWNGRWTNIVALLSGRYAGKVTCPVRLIADLKIDYTVYFSLGHTL
jgi:hypothetical protein